MLKQTKVSFHDRHETLAFWGTSKLELCAWLRSLVLSCESSKLWVWDQLQVLLKSTVTAAVCSWGLIPEPHIIALLVFDVCPSRLALILMGLEAFWWGFCHCELSDSGKMIYVGTSVEQSDSQEWRKWNPYKAKCEDVGILVNFRQYFNIWRLLLHLECLSINAMCPVADSSTAGYLSFPCCYIKSFSQLPAPLSPFLCSPVLCNFMRLHC